MMDAQDREAIKTLVDRRVRLLCADDPQAYAIRRYRPRPTQLTEAQLTVLRLAALGLSIQQSAAFLERSPITVGTQRKTALHRLKAKTMPQAVAIAYRRGLLWSR